MSQKKKISKIIFFQGKPYQIVDTNGYTWYVNQEVLDFFKPGMTQGVLEALESYKMVFIDEV